MPFDKQTYNQQHYQARKARAAALQRAWDVFVRNAAIIVPVLPDADRAALEAAFEVIEQ
jgi:hypothetical protein